MLFFSPIEVTEATDCGKVAERLAEMFSDDVDVEAVKEILAQGQVVTPAQFVLDTMTLLAELDVKMLGPLTMAAPIPGQRLEEAVPKSHRASTVISRLLGEEVGEIPTSAVYDLVDLLTVVEVPESKEETAVIGEVLARAILGITSQIPEEIQMEAGLIHYRNAYNERLSALIDPDAEAAPEEEMTAGT